MTVAALVSVVLILLILGGLPIFLALGIAGTLGVRNLNWRDVSRGRR